MDWRDRLIAEHKELSDRLDKLNHVLVAGGAPVSPGDRRAQLEPERDELAGRLARLNKALEAIQLPDKQRGLMTVQAFLMADYLDVLEKRIALS